MLLTACEFTTSAAALAGKEEGHVCWVEAEAPGEVRSSFPSFPGASWTHIVVSFALLIFFCFHYNLIFGLCSRISVGIDVSMLFSYKQ